MKTKTPTHTPGPWNVTPSSYGHGRYIAVRSKDILAPIADNILLERDARLIAAAPDFKEAAERALDNSIDQIEAIDESFPEMDECPIWAQSVRENAVRIRDDARAAIAKAEGDR